MSSEGYTPTIIRKSDIAPIISPEMVVRLVEAAIKSKTNELEIECAKTLCCWRSPAVVVSGELKQES